MGVNGGGGINLSPGTGVLASDSDEASPDPDPDDSLGSVPAVRDCCTPLRSGVVPVDPRLWRFRARSAGGSNLPATISAFTTFDSEGISVGTRRGSI